MQRKKILFVYDLEQEPLWKDGLWAAIQLLKMKYDVDMLNLYGKTEVVYQHEPGELSFVLGWGAFGGPVDSWVRTAITGVPKGLCIGGYAPVVEPQAYSVLFYETEWSKKWLEGHYYIPPEVHLVHAFGVNTDIYKRNVTAPMIWDITTVGAFALWKRQNLLIGKPGNRLAVGQIQKNNLQESIDIIGNLLLDGVAISDMVDPEQLAKIYACSRLIYIPADVMGGGERAVLEARACRRQVSVEPDNPKLQELLTCTLWDHHYYADQLEKGIELCLKRN